VVKIPSELQGARLNVTRTAELFAMDAGHIRRLSRRGVLPSPKRTSKDMPYYNYELLTQIAEVLKSGIGRNGEEISFYRRQPKPERKRRTRSKDKKHETSDSYIESVIQGCKGLGIAKDKLGGEAVKKLLAEEFGDERPELNEAIPMVARRLLQDDG